MDQLNVEKNAWAKEIRTVTFLVVIPIILVVGVMVNILSLYILQRPRMQGQPAMSYLKALLSLDVVGLVVYISGCVTVDGCEVHSYNMSLYFLHIFYTIFFILNVFCHYIIVWLCYDRFLALWFFHRFQETQQPKVVRRRLIFSGLLCISLYTKHMIDVDVKCVSYEGVVQSINYTEECENGTWILQDSYHQLKSVGAWHDVALGAYMVVGMVVPVVVVVVFSSALVVGMIRRRLKNTAATSRTREQTYNAIYLTVAISLYRIFTVTVIVSFVIMYTRNTTHCYDLKSQKLRLAVHYFLVVERTINILFLAINQTFREELKAIFYTVKKCLGNAFLRKSHTRYPTSLECPEMRNKQVVLEACNNIKQSRYGSKVMISSPEVEEEFRGVTNVQFQVDGGMAIPSQHQSTLSVPLAREGKLSQ